MSAQSLKFSQCTRGCCDIITKPYLAVHEDYSSKYKKCKAGVFFYDSKAKKVLLVQSRGEKWGPPKGTMENIDKTIEDCAVREVEEETGLQISVDTLSTCSKYCIDRATYFYLETDSAQCESVYIPGGHGNDATGIMWISVQCLRETPRLDLNSHCKKLLSKYTQ